MTNYSQFQTNTNRMVAQGAEKVATRGVMIGISAVKAFFNFLKEMLFTFLGK